MNGYGFRFSKSHSTVYPKKYAHGFVVLCFVVFMQSFIMNSHEVFIHIHQGCFAGTGAIVRLPQCQWSKPDGYGKISQRITTTKHSKAKTVCIFLGIYCTSHTKKYAFGFRFVVLGLWLLGTVWFYPWAAGSPYGTSLNGIIAPAPVAVKKPWRIWINESHQFANNWCFNYNKTTHN